MNFEQERNEAIWAGERALQSLNDAKQYLNSAGNWGLLDMFGGGLFSTFMKHSKMNNASQCLNQAKYELQAFNKELHDVDMAMSSINTNDFLSFADFFFDGFFADFLMQSRINESKRQVDFAINKVQQALAYLKSL